MCSAVGFFEGPTRRMASLKHVLFVVQSELQDRSLAWSVLPQRSGTFSPTGKAR